MKKSISVLLFVVALMISNQNYAQELTWLSWADGYAKAKTEKKIILLDVYTEWCGWCKVMDQKTYSQADIITLIGKDFVPVKLNPELDGTYEYEGTTYTGSELITKLSTVAGTAFSGYPTCFFVFTKDKTVKMEVGYKDATAFKTILTNYAPVTNEGTETNGSTGSKGKKQGKN